MSDIPPEGDEYNARRQEELHAAVLNKSQLTRRMAEMIRDQAPLDQINAVIDTIAQIDREIPHISKDLAVSVQGRNLSIFMDRMDISLQRVDDRVEQSAIRVVSEIQISIDMMMSLVQQVLSAHREDAARLGKIERRMDDSEADRADLRSRLERIERILADRRAIELLGGGDGQ